MTDTTTDHACRQAGAVTDTATDAAPAPTRPFGVRDAIPLVLAVGLIVAGFLLLGFDVGGNTGFVLLGVGLAFSRLFAYREGKRTGDARWTAYYEPSQILLPEFRGLDDMRNTLGYANPASPLYRHRHDR